MKIDLYTKSVLTVIALALTVIALRGFGAGPAIAQLGGACGSIKNPCYVDSILGGMDVNVKN